MQPSPLSNCWTFPSWSRFNSCFHTASPALPSTALGITAFLKSAPPWSLKFSPKLVTPILRFDANAFLIEPDDARQQQLWHNYPPTWAPAAVWHILMWRCKMWKHVVLEWVPSVSAQLQPQSCCISSDSLPCRVLWVVSFAPLSTPQCFGKKPSIAPMVSAPSILVYIIVFLPGPRAPYERNILFIFASAVPRIIWAVK